MIVEWLLAFFDWGVRTITAPLPSDSTQVWNYVNDIAENLGALNYFLPIAETISLVVAVFALFPVFLGITLGLWVAAQLRGSSSVG